jgi:tetratricopeptide (TPR) repeat protein
MENNIKKRFSLIDKIDALKHFTIISINVIVSVILIIIILYFLPSLYFVINPSELWWTALSINVAMSCVVIAISVAVLLKEKESKEKIVSLEKNLEKYKTKSINSYENALSFISNVLDVQNLSETSSVDNWDRIKININKMDDFGTSKSLPLRIWSTVAWKQGYLDIALLFREKAYLLDKNDFRNRVMLCSILIVKDPDITRIENILNNTDLKSDNITDVDIDHFYNVKGTFNKKIGRFEEASESFKKALIPRFTI